MQDRDKGLNRREFIKKSAGTMGVLAILSSPLIAVLNRAKASADTTQTIPNKAVILFDDYIGSGATLQEAARALKKEANFQNPMIPVTIAMVKWHLGKPGFV